MRTCFTGYSRRLRCEPWRAHWRSKAGVSVRQEGKLLACRAGKAQRQANGADATNLARKWIERR